MLRIQENVLMMDEEGNRFWKLMDAEECIACYQVKALVDVKYGEPIEVANYFFSRLEDAEDKVRMIKKYREAVVADDDGEQYYEPFGVMDGSDILFEDLVEWGRACVSINPIRAMR
jgi:hypothetical protein